MAATILNTAAEQLVPLTLANTLGALGANTDRVFYPHNEWYTQAARYTSVALQFIASAGMVSALALPDMAKAVAFVALAFSGYMWLEENNTFISPTIMKTLNIAFNCLAIGTAAMATTLNPVVLGVNAVCLLINGADYHAHLTRA